MTRLTCSDCDHWAEGGEGIDGQGECRRHAPTAINVWLVARAALGKTSALNAKGFHEVPDMSTDDTAVNWPMTYGYDWCGEFKEKP